MTTMTTTTRLGVPSSSSSGGGSDDSNANKEVIHKWLGEYSDQITVAIALREWGEAVSLLEKGQSVLAEHQSAAAKAGA